MTPSIESLESRDLLSAVLVLDFSPDKVPGEPYRPAPFARVFQGQPTGSATGLDVNHNGRLDRQDASLLARQIAVQTRVKVAHFGVRVVGGDVLQDTNLGQRWLARGRANPHLLVDVVYVGGFDKGHDPSTLGYGYQAPVNRNFETYGYVFSQPIWYWEKTAPTSILALELACDSVHEWGHLIGLGHPNTDTIDNVMDFQTVDRDVNQATFPNRRIRTELFPSNHSFPFFGWQNPAREIAASLHQPTIALGQTYFE